MQESWCGPILAIGILRDRGFNMTFKIEKTYSGQVTTLRLSGRLEFECLGVLKEQIEHSGPQVELDLAELELVDVEVVRFLNACQNEGVGIANGSPYIREWMLREGLFNLIKSLPPSLRYEPGTIVAEGDFVIVHGRFSGFGAPVNWIAGDILRIQDGILVEHWDVIQDEATEEQSKSKAPMFGTSFPKHPA